MTPSSRKSQGFSLLIAVSMLLGALSCRQAARPLAWLLSREATPIQALSIPSTATAAALTPSHTSTPSPTGTPTATLTRTPLPSLPPSSTPILFPSRPASGASPTPLSAGIQLRIFEKLWSIVNEEYLYADFNGLDWDAAGEKYRRQIETGLSSEAFYIALAEMIFSLGDEHSAFLPPQEAEKEDAKFSGDYSFVGIGVLASPVPERRRAVILLVFPGSPADAAGLKSHDSILSIDGEPILDEDGRLRNLLLGPEGSRVKVAVQSPGEEPREISFTRQRVQGPVPVPFSVVTTPRGKSVGYIFLVTFVDQTVDDQVGKALQLMSFGKPLDGVILDLRMNEGGTDAVMSGILSYFTHGELGSFVNRREERPLRVVKRDVLGSQEQPLILLIGKETVSFGEIFAGILQNTQRAYVIGETTLGNVEILWGYDFIDGSRAWIAHDIFRPANEEEQNWEKTGIIPDQTLPVDWDEVTLETDPAVEAALEYLDR